MMCSNYKRKISQCLDSEKSLPNKILSHLTQCQSCKQFYQDSQSLNEKLSSEGKTLLKDDHKDLNQRLITAFKDQSKPVKPKVNRRLFVPAFASAIVVLIIGLGVIFQFIPIGSPSSDSSPLNVVSQLNLKGEAWSVYVKNLESPLQSEAKGLRESVQSASDFLLACLDYKIGQINKNN